jgi:hypothetical protein
MNTVEHKFSNLLYQIFYIKSSISNLLYQIFYNKSSISNLLYESNVPVVSSEKRCEDEKRSAIVICAEYETYPERRGDERRRW